MLQNLANEPVLTVERAAERWGTSTSAAYRALTELAEAGLLGRTKDQKGKLVCYTADAHLGLVALTGERLRRYGLRPPKLAPDAPSVEHVGRLFR